VKRVRMGTSACDSTWTMTSEALREGSRAPRPATLAGQRDRRSFVNSSTACGRFLQSHDAPSRWRRLNSSVGSTSLSLSRASSALGGTGLSVALQWARRSRSPNSRSMYIGNNVAFVLGSSPLQRATCHAGFARVPRGPDGLTIDPESGAGTAGAVTFGPCSSSSSRGLAKCARIRSVALCVDVAVCGEVESERHSGGVGGDAAIKPAGTINGFGRRASVLLAVVDEVMWRLPWDCTVRALSVRLPRVLPGSTLLPVVLELEAAGGVDVRGSRKSEALAKLNHAREGIGALSSQPMVKR
jgi:hypothetical protein